MLELWLGREYQFKPGGNEPKWIDAQSINRVSDWGLEIIIQNTPIFEAFHRLEHANLAEVKYIWGNHDCYLKSKHLSMQLGLPSRDPNYNGLSEDIFSEHGHRFDRSNYDNISSDEGPKWANRAYKFPDIRKLEPAGRAVASLGHPSEELHCYLLGASLIYLYERYDQKLHPFSIYIMGHSHRRKLYRFNVRAEFHLHEGSG